MSKEEILYKQLKETNPKLFNTLGKEIMQLVEENKQLRDNWNKLKEYIKENSFDFEDGCCYVIHDVKMVYRDDILDKMQELEKGDRNE